MAAQVPGAPADVEMYSQSSTSIEISWSTPDNGGTPLTDYRIYSDQASNGASFVEIIPSTGLVNNYAINFGIAADSVYQFKVLAVNALGNSELSLASEGIRAATVPQTPSHPILVSATTSEIVIRWNEPAFDGGSAILFYSVYISTDSSDYQLYLDTLSGSE